METVKPTTETQLQAYCNRVCDVLSGWAKGGRYAVRGTPIGSATLGVGLVVFEKVVRSEASTPMKGINKDMLAALDDVRRAATQNANTLDLVRGVMAFSGTRLYLVKPISHRYWTQTAALNDADEIAGTILMRSPKEGA